MPTFNQLVRSGRQQVSYKSTAPALQRGLNTLENKATNLPSPRGQGENDTRKQHYHKKFSYNFVDFFRKVRII